MQNKKGITAIVIASAIIMPGAVSAAEITVKPGDTLYSLSVQNSVTVDQIKKWNGLKDNNIVVGQTLIVAQVRKGVVVNAENLNIRTGPGVNYGVKAVIKGGTEVEILKESGTWLQIKTGIVEGYVSSSYIKELVSNTTPEKVQIKNVSGLFKEQGKNKVSSLSPQQVTVIKTGTNGWMQVQTWLGPLWVKDGINAEASSLPQQVYLTQVSGLFKEIGKDRVSSLKPQNVKVIEHGQDGWIKIETWLGQLWTKNGVMTETATATQKVYISKTSGLFSEPGKNKVSSLSPQNVTVLDRNSEGWLKIQTWLGPLWVKDGVTTETVKAPAKITITKASGLFKQQGKEKISMLSPQPVVLIQSGTDGWNQVQTWLGPLWVKDGVVEEYKEPVPESPATTENIIHIVVSGDTLSKLAIKYKTTVSKIMSINKLTTDVLQIGQKLTVSEDASLKIFTMPILGNVVKTSDFGPRWGTIHYGTDFSKGGEAEIVAAADGIVTRSQSHYSYGEVIHIQHVINGERYETLYAHMKEGTRAVKVGDVVKAGQFIGWMGSTGNSTGPHLHFEVHIGEYRYGQGTAVDPLLYIK